MLIQVTAAIIRREGQYLICQRAHDDALPLLWEFPGGKLEEGRTRIADVADLGEEAEED